MTARALVANLNVSRRNFHMTAKFEGISPKETAEIAGGKRKIQKSPIFFERVVAIGNALQKVINNTNVISIAAIQYL